MKPVWKMLPIIVLGAYLLFIAISMAQLSSMVGFIQDHPFRVGRHVQELSISLGEMQNNMQKILYSHFSQPLESREELSGHEKQMLKNMEGVCNNLKDNPDALAALEKALENLFGIYDGILKDLQDGQETSKAQTVFAQEGQNAARQLYEAIDRILEASLSKTQAMQSKMNQKMVLTTLLSVIFGIFIGWLFIAYANKLLTFSKEVRARERMLEFLSQHVDEIFIVAKDAEHFIYVSPNSGRLFNVPKDKMQANPESFYATLDGEDALWLKNALNGKRAKGGIQERDLPPTSTGAYFRICVYPVDDKALGDAKFIVSISDQTKAILHQEQMSAALNSANAANVAKSSFLAHMSHEIRTPMNAIIGMTTIALSKLGNWTRVEDCLRKVSESSKHLLGLINEVLDMSKIESGKLLVNTESFSLVAIIDNVANLMMPQMEERGLKLEIVPQNVEIENLRGDPLRLNQILINIMGNALKFTPAGGIVRLQIQQLKKDQQKVWMRFIISDNGIGMSQEVLERLFKPFEQANASTAGRYGGTGLGMSISYNLVSLMGGKINVNSQEGKGTVFTVDLPFEIDLMPPLPAESLPSLRILVVDDDADTCEHAAILLDKMGLETVCVNSGIMAEKQALEAQESGKQFNVCLVDWKMPDMNGIEAARRLREITGGETLIIMISAYNWQPIEQEARAAGINGFVPKPFFASTLYDALSAVIGKRAQLEKIPSQSPSQDMSGHRVLLVEDNQFNREIAEEFLAMGKMEVEMAENGKEGVAKFLAAPHGYYDIILMDVQMPVMNGYEATTAIRNSDHPDAATIPILAMTANAFSEDVLSALNAGMNDHLSKPIDLDVLYTLLQKWIVRKPSAQEDKN